MTFGFLLQKGGVAEFHILVGALLLEDFTVMKIMLSAVAVGIVGVTVLRRLKLISLSVETFQPSRNIVGGLVFGVGFALSGYCPGTGAAALGRLNGDSLSMVAGMLVGSYVFALSSAKIGKLGDSQDSNDVRLTGRTGMGEVVPAFGIAALLSVAVALLPG
ncbi:YeeE/YedE thiosulfate transporter family protein [Pelagicoccus enzymogenes]|nr:YeeE/YedE thiosulfate transporter family protein [Pelagicoccus enzymogenes]